MERDCMKLEEFVRRGQAAQRAVDALTKPPEKDEIGPCEESKPIPKGAQCQEASVLSRESYIPCRAPAVAIVRHDKDRRSYYMCLPCADHNIRNRGGKLIRVNFAGRVLVQRARKLGRDCRDEMR